MYPLEISNPLHWYRLPLMCARIRFSRLGPCYHIMNQLADINLVQISHLTWEI